MREVADIDRVNRPARFARTRWSPVPDRRGSGRQSPDLQAPRTGWPPGSTCCRYTRRRSRCTRCSARGRGFPAEAATATRHARAPTDARACSVPDCRYASRTTSRSWPASRREGRCARQRSSRHRRRARSHSRSRPPDRTGSAPRRRAPATAARGGDRDRAHGGYRPAALGCPDRESAHTVLWRDRFRSSRDGGRQWAYCASWAVASLPG